MSVIKKPVTAEDRRSIYCACGCQWHGRVATAAKEVIAAHLERAVRGGKLGCGMLNHSQFAAKFKCRCFDCSEARRITWNERRALRRRVKAGA